MYIYMQGKGAWCVVYTALVICPLSLRALTVHDCLQPLPTPVSQHAEVLKTSTTALGCICQQSLQLHFQTLDSGCGLV